MSKYNRPFSIDDRKPVPIESNDPRSKNLEKYRSRLGRDILNESLPKVLELKKSNISNSCTYWLSAHSNSGDALGIATDLLAKQNHALIAIKPSNAINNNTTNTIYVKYSNKKEILLMKSLFSQDSFLSLNDIKLNINNNLILSGSRQKFSTYEIEGAFAVCSPDLSSILSAKKIYHTTEKQWVVNDFQYVITQNSANVDLSIIHIDNSNNYYVIGNHQTDNPNWPQTDPQRFNGIYLAKISSDGSSILWQKLIKYSATDLDGFSIIGFPLASLSIRGYKLYNNKIYIICTTSAAAGVAKIYCLVFDLSGNLITQSALANIPTVFYFNVRIVFDNNDNMYIFIQPDSNNANQPNYLLSKFDSSLNHIWTKEIPAFLGSSTGLGDSIAIRNFIDKNNDMYLIMSIGRATGVPLIYKLFLFKISLDGSLIFSNRIGGPYDTLVINGVSTDIYDNMYVSFTDDSNSSTYAYPCVMYVPSDGSIPGTGIYSTNLADNTVEYQEYPTTIMGSSYTPYFYSINDLSVSADALAIDNLSLTIQDVTYPQSSTCLS